MFSSANDGEFKKHFRRAPCRTARSILFCCKLCDYVGHSIKDIKKHACTRVRFEFNEMERLRAAQLLPSPRRLVTTVAEHEWYKMEEQLKEMRVIMNNPDLQLTQVSLSHREQMFLVPGKLLYSLCQYRKWLHAPHVGLPNLSVENICQVIRNRRYADRFFVFQVHDECDVRHYFKLLFAKADAAYWPFCVDNATITHWVYNSTWCPFSKTVDDGQVYVKQTRDELLNALYESRYTNWHWSRMSRGDFHRFVCREWTTLHYKNIIKIVGSLADVINHQWTDLDAEQGRVREKIEKLFPTLFDFVSFWDAGVDAVVNRVELNDLTLDDVDLYECVELSLTFEEAVSRFVGKKKQRGWLPLMRVFRSSN
jgi:hypothetical protein